jgi:hypothetical protein
MDNVQYLLTCSDLSRDSFILAKLDQSARLRKEIARLLHEWIEAESQALLGDMIREIRRAKVTDATESPAIPDFLCSRLERH